MRTREDIMALSIKPPLIFLVLFVLFAARTTEAATNWRPFDTNDLTLKASIVEKDADAEALFWNVWIDDAKGSKTIFTHYIRVKIFTSRGAESQSRVDLPYFG